MPFKALHIIAHGMVQGVGFRFFVRERSLQYGIKGWVRNLPDGTVEIHAEGEEERLDLFIAEVRRGPSFGHVARLVKEWVEPKNKYNDFRIVF